ncbi:MAG TPA: hypothetical protein VHV80_10945 [Steroidobacteraceae bacterium]|jgi:hypothetical protein|nr:hypothetical protein [Steroidobacteraceae bacterium]
MHRLKFGYLACGLLAVGLAQAAVAATPTRICTAYPWNVSREVALFAGAPTTVHASVAVTPAPAIETGRFYAVGLSAQSRVHFALPPGKTMLTGGDEGGILRLKVPAAGLYRVSVDEPFWIDVVADGRLVPATDFHGSPDCAGPRKIVEFALPRGTLLLQLSGYVHGSVHLTVTRARRSRVRHSGSR